MKPQYTARNKLNIAHINGAIIISSFIGLGSESFVVFFLALAICIGLAVHSGGIRG
jgi:hypothetical protein